MPFRYRCHKNSAANKVIAIKDLSYTGDFGLQELLERSEDILADEAVMEEIDASSYWSMQLTNKVLQVLKARSFYLTNIVKWTGNRRAAPL